MPYSSHCSAGEYCSSCRALFLARYCGVWVVSVCVWCLCGGVSSVHSPLTLVVGGAITDRAGGIADGGWHDEGRAAVFLAPPRTSVSPPVCVLVSPFRLCGGPVEWREWWVVCCPRVWIGSGTLRCPSSLHIVRPLLYCSCSSSVLCCRVCCGWGSVVGELCFVLLFSFCVCCHSIVGLWLCLCGRVVSL